MADPIVVFMIFGVFGIGLETFFTAILDYLELKDRRLLGYSSLWYFPIYALLPPAFCIVYPNINGSSIIVRGLVYMILIYVSEYFYMLLLRKLLGESPSERSYYKSRWNVHGLIRLDFAPAWFAAGLIFEILFKRLVL